MKKLMTTLSAVGVALGLYAATGDISGTSFEQLDAGAYNITQPGNIGNGGEINDPDGGTYWVTNDTATLTIAEGPSISGMDNRPAAFEGKPQTRYLDIKTTLGNAVEREVNLDGSASEIGDGLYFDSLVKFTAFEDEESANSSLSNGGKLAIWLKQDDADNPTVTNLMITAGYLTVNSVVVTNYSCKINGVAANYLNDGGWHRITVRAINSIYESLGGDAVPGFVVYIDGHRAYTDDINGSTDPRNTKGINVSDLTAAAAYEHTTAKGALFPSAEQGTGGTKTQIRAVAFDGQGSVDDIVFTTADPFGTTTDFFTIEAGANVESLTYHVDDGSESDPVYAGGKASIPYTENMIVTITPTYSAGCVADTWDTESATYSKNIVSPSAAGGSVTVKGVLSRASVSYEEGGVLKTKSCPTLADAIDFIDERSGGAYSISLSGNASGAIVLGDNNDTATILLDLKGHDIDGDGAAQAINLKDGTLIITNSTETIGHVTNSTIAVKNNGVLTLAGGYFDGAINIGNNATSTTITGGAFDAVANATLAANEDVTLPTGKTLVAGTGDFAGYLVLGDAPQPQDSWEARLGAPVDGAYLIDDYTDLTNFQAGVAAGLETSNVTFKLTADIPLEAAWPGIGIQNGKDLANGTNEVNFIDRETCIAEYDAGAFKGTFDGQNYTISNFQMVGGGLDYAGFFNSIKDATIQNLKIAYAGSLFATDTTASSAESGATFVGVAKKSTLQNLTTVAGTVSCSKGFGGIVGYLMGGTTVDSCTNNVDMTSLKKNKCGGIAMITQNGSGAAVIRNCQNNGTQETESSNSEYGAIVGYVGIDTTIENCETTVGRFLKHQGGTVTLQGVNKGDARVLAYHGTATPGLNFATVDGNVATFVADNALALNGSYKVMAAGAAPTFAFAEAGTISFDTNLTQNVLFTGITASDNLEVVDTTADGVVTFTATESSSEIDPQKEVLAVDVTATDETDATNKVEVAVPAGSGAVAAEYKALFKLTATEKSAGVYTVEITGIKDDVVADVSEDAVDALTDTTKTTIDIPAGLYYRISPGAALPITITTVSTRQGLSTGSVDKPTITGGDGSKGFYKVELSPKPFPVLPPES